MTPMTSDSYETWRQDNARGAELNQPTKPANPESAKDLPPIGRDTNVENPEDLYGWENDPQLL